MNGTFAKHSTDEDDPPSLDRIIHHIPVEQVERHLWDRTFQHRDGSFVKSLLEQMGQTGGTLHQVRAFVHQKQKDLLAKRNPLHVE